MQRTGVYLTLVMSLLPVTDSRAEIVVAYDRFKGITKVATKPTLPPYQRPEIHMGAALPKETPHLPAFYLNIVYRTQRWEYLSCHQTYWLADGKPVMLPQPTHQGDVDGGGVLEQLLIAPIELEQFQQLARAQQVEYKICNDEYRASPAAMQDFQTVLSYIQKFQPGESSSKFSSTPPSSSTPPPAPLTEAELDAKYEAARQQDTVAAYQDFLYRRKAYEKHYAEALARLDELLHPGGTKHTGSPQRTVSPARARPPPSVSTPSPNKDTYAPIYNETSTADNQLHDAEREFRAGRMSLEEFR
jgi:hypothetical protein